MKYNLDSATAFGSAIKDMLAQKSYALIDKYKEYSKSSIFNTKVNNNDEDKETNTSTD